MARFLAIAYFVGVAVWFWLVFNASATFGQ
jgi:hypothetical protein